MNRDELLKVAAMLDASGDPIVRDLSKKAATDCMDAVMRTANLAPSREASFLIATGALSHLITLHMGMLMALDPKMTVSDYIGNFGELHGKNLRTAEPKIRQRIAEADLIKAQRH